MTINKYNHSPRYIFSVLAVSFGVLLASHGVLSYFDQLNIETMRVNAVAQQEAAQEKFSQYETEIEQLQAKNKKASATIKEQKEEIAELKQIAERAQAQKSAVVYSSPATSSPATSSPTGSNSGAYIGDFTITYYCGENYPHICGTGNGVTASGATAAVGVTIAADPNVLPMGTRVYIEGVGERVVQDVGGVIIGNKIDVYVGSHSEAMSNGRHTAKVYRA